MKKVKVNAPCSYTKVTLNKDENGKVTSGSIYSEGFTRKVESVDIDEMVSIIREFTEGSFCNETLEKAKKYL